MLYDFYKKKETDTIWWTSEVGKVGHIIFSFYKKTLFYPLSARRPLPLRWGMNCASLPNVHKTTM